MSPKRLKTVVIPRPSLGTFYVVLSLIAGTILVFFDAHPSRNDFEAQWARARQVASFNFLSDPDPSGSGVYGGYDADGTFQSFNNTAVNSPLAYLPSIFSGGNFYVASLLTLVFSVAFVYLGFRIAKDYGLIILAMALHPLVFLSFVYPTADAMTNSFTLLVLGQIFRIFQDGFTKRSTILITVSALVLGQLRATCIILLLLLLVPVARDLKRDETGHRRFDWQVLAPAIAVCLSWGLWRFLTKDISPSLVGTKAQVDHALHGILANPVGMLQSMVVSILWPLDCVGDKYNTGRNIGFFTGAEFTQLSALVMAPLLLAEVLLVLMNNEILPRLSKADVTIAVLTILGYSAATFAALYATFSFGELGYYVGGIQSRYFIPVVPLFALLIPKLGVSFANREKTKSFVIGLVLWTYVAMTLVHVLPIP